MMRNRTSGWRARNGVVSAATMPSTVGIAAILISPESLSLSAVDLLPHRAGIADDAPRPVERALALGRKALEARAALHQHHAEDFLELLEAGRHRRLGDAAGLGGAPEMTLLGQRQQKFKLVDQERNLRDNLEDTAITSTTADRRNNTPKTASRLQHYPGIHSIFKSTDFIFVLIAFPYRSMRQLY